MSRVVAVALTVLLGAACGGNEGAAPTTSPREGTPGPATAEASPRLPATTPETGTPASPPSGLAPGAAELAIEVFPVPAGSRPHDVAPAADGGVWFTAQGSGQLGWLDPATGTVRMVELGPGSSPHGVIVGPDGAAWVTDSGLNAVVRVAGAEDTVTVYPLPADRPNANLNTATFDGDGILWFTGQNGVYGRLDRATGEVTVFDAPRGRGPYGIATDPAGTPWLASLAGSYLGRIDGEAGAIELIDPPAAGAGIRRVWADSQGRLWVSEWIAGQVGVYDPAIGSWREWKLPGERPRAYAVYVDEFDMVWLSDFGANAIVRFDPRTDEFDSFPLPGSPGNVRQLHGRPGEVWGAESATDRLVVIR